MKHYRLHTFLRRCCALTLVAALTVPVGAAWGDTKLESSHEILDGLSYTDTVSSYSAGRLASYVLELDKNSDVFPILIQSSGTIYGSATVNAAVTEAQNRGYQVLAGVNTDYFSTATGVPMGIVIEDGVYKSDADGNPAMLIKGNKVQLCRKPVVSLTLTNRENDAEIVPNYFNKYRAATGGVYLLNEHFSTVSTRTSTSGWYVRMKIVNYDPDNKAHRLGVNSTLKLEVTELLQGSTPLSIGPGEYILTADNVSNKLSVFESFQLGDRITLTTECEDKELSKAEWAGGVGDILVEDGRITDPAGWEKVDYADSVRAPRTALGVRKNGTLVVCAVDGRQSKHSVGLTVTDLAAEMEAQGCEWAVNLDGGGSTSVSVWVPGQTAPALQNSPSDGKARPCATFLMLVSERKGNGRAKQVALTESGITVLVGSSVELPKAVALDSGLNVLDKDVTDLTVTSRTGLGDVDDKIYTAGRVPGTDQLRLRSRDLGISGEASIQIVDELSELTVTDSAGKAITALTAKPGDQIILNAVGTYWGRTALRSMDGVEVLLDEKLGSAEDGVVTINPAANAGGTITLRAGGVEKVIPVTLRGIHTDIPEGHWAYPAVEYCYMNGIVSGVSPTEFGANNLIRRCDFLLMLYAALGRPAVSTPCTFTDVDPGDYFYTAMAWAQSNNLVSGSGDGSCNATATINREQAFAILYKALPLLGKHCPDAPLAALSKFADRDTVSDYARTPAATLVAQGVVSGNGSTLNPKGNLTRAELAALLHKVCTYTPVSEYPDYGQTPAVPDAPAAPTAPDAPAVPETPAQTPALPIDKLPLGAVTGMVTDAQAGLNVRSGPGTGHEVLEKLKNEASVLILGVSEGWYHILYTGESGTFAQGYVSADYVNPTARAGVVTDAQAGLNVRSGPGTNHEALEKIPNESAVIVLGEQDGWYQIRYLNAEGVLSPGYVSADYVTLAQ